MGISLGNSLRISLVGSLLPLASAAGGEPRATLETTTVVPAEHDGCLDHAVRELGMSAKRQGKDRLWVIGPQFLHSAVARDGAMRLELLPGSGGTTVRLELSWPGGAKEPAVQAEMEQRAAAIPFKMGQVCGVVKPTVRCSFAPAGGAAAACKGAQ